MRAATAGTADVAVDALAVDAPAVREPAALVDPVVVVEPVAVVGAGRLGTALTAALRAAGTRVSGPHRRGYDGTGAAVVLLCVPDGAIATAAGAVRPGPLVGHCSGATGLEVLGRRGFRVHPLMTVPTTGARFDGVTAAVAGTDPAALAIARAVADRLGLRPVEVAEVDRVAYHAAAAMASNFLVTLESAAADLMSTAGLDRQVLVPLARAALENWAASGPAALTGPVARGDEAVVAAHRQVIAERRPEALALFDELVTATRRLV